MRARRQAASAALPAPCEAASWVAAWRAYALSALDPFASWGRVQSARRLEPIREPRGSLSSTIPALPRPVGSSAVSASARGGNESVERVE